MSVLTDPSFEGSEVEALSQRSASLFMDILKLTQMDSGSAAAENLRESVQNRLKAYDRDDVWPEYRKAVLALGQGDLLPAGDVGESSVGDAGSLGG